MFSFSSLLRDLYDPAEYRYGSLNDYLAPPQDHLNAFRPRHQPSVGICGKGDSRSDSSKFQVMLNIKHFRPEEIDVKIVDNFVVIHGKHEEHADEHGFVSREFTRRYQIPDDVEPEKITSSLSRDGVLTIQAPRKMLDPPKNERVVPIILQRPVAVENMKKRLERYKEERQQSAESSNEE